MLKLYFLQSRSVTQCQFIFKVLPEYLSKWTTEKVRSEGVKVIPNTSIQSAQLDPETNKMVLTTSDGQVTDYKSHMNAMYTFILYSFFNRIPSNSLYTVLFYEQWFPTSK